MGKKWTGYFLMAILWSVQVCAQNNSQIFLPKPEGSYMVGSKSYIINNPEGGKKHNKIFVKIWYPSDSIAPLVNHAKYLQGYDLDEIYKNFKTKGITREEIDRISNYYTNTSENLPISVKKQSFPVVLFTPGYFFGLSDIYSVFTENLASNGFIVCSITHLHEQINQEGCDGEDHTLHKPRSALAFLQWWWTRQRCLANYEKPENQERLTKYYLRNLTRFDEVIRRWEAASMFCVDYFKNNAHSDEVFQKMDFDRLGAFGQSLGGALSNHMCVDNDIIKASVSMDCFQFGDVVSATIEKPLMLIESDHQFSWQVGNEYIYRNFKELEYLKFKGSLHFLFCDVPYYDAVTSEEKIKGFIGDTQGKEAIEIINRSVLSFFERHLNNKPSDIEDLLVNNKLFLHQINNQCIFLK